MCQLAVLLVPSEPIAEVFRSFPAPSGWRRRRLLPDLTAHGALKEPCGAFFVEYDGHQSHRTKRGRSKDRRKNEALLSLAPNSVPRRRKELICSKNL